MSGTDNSLTSGLPDLRLQHNVGTLKLIPPYVLSLAMTVVSLQIGFTVTLPSQNGVGNIYLYLNPNTTVGVVYRTFRQNAIIIIFITYVHAYVTVGGVMR